MCPALMIVDDDRNILNVLQRELRGEVGTIYACQSGEEALQALNGRDIDVVLSDNNMPGIDGLTLLETIRQRRPEIVRMLMTGYSTEDCVVEAVNRSGVFGYLRKPWRREELRDLLARAFDQAGLGNSSASDTGRSADGTSIGDAEREAVLMLALAAEAKDDDTGDHVQRVGDLTRNLCRELGLSEAQTEEFGFFSMIHDVGKIHIPDHILSKPGALTDEEWTMMKQHTVYGEKILNPGSGFATARQIARYHHERWDGSGYPDGLSGVAIPLAARIVAVADVYDALTRKRPYKPAWRPEVALSEIRSQAGRMFDPEIVAAFLTGQDGYEAASRAE